MEKVNLRFSRPFSSYMMYTLCDAGVIIITMMDEEPIEQIEHSNRYLIRTIIIIIYTFLYVDIYYQVVCWLIIAQSAWLICYSPRSAAAAVQRKKTTKRDQHRGNRSITIIIHSYI